MRVQYTVPDQVHSEHTMDDAVFGVFTRRNLFSQTNSSEATVEEMTEIFRVVSGNAYISQNELQRAKRLNVF